ncbi:MAG: TIGR03905 family TSCPD domain-containing protein [Clostridia bacterium]|nr:TIGR03905 family TSCPD domain-containing protein [Clostridia bacterium]
MEKTLTYQTKGTCARAIELVLDDGIIVSARFVGGCSGNTQGVAALVKGMEIKEAISRLKGIRCGMKPTSCPDQLALALEQFQNEQ